MNEFPGFFIIGAQKAGTTALASLLAQHSGIQFSDPKEPLFFSRDEAWLHPLFFMEQREAFQAFDWQHHHQALIAGYLANAFPHPQNGRLRGEGSTSYLISRYAAPRIMQYKPDAKIIVMLRDPVRRAYSAYWHFIKTGLSIHSFEKHLQYESGLTLQMGHYVEHIRYWQQYVPKEQMIFLLYESFRDDPVNAYRFICTKLGLEPEEVDSGRMNRNAAEIPRYIKLHRALNLMQRWLGDGINAVTSEQENSSPEGKVLGAIARWNLRDQQYRPMHADTKAQLTTYYRRVNAGISELIGKDVDQVWYK